MRAQTAMEPVICLGCRGSKMIPLELALAVRSVRSGPFGAHRQVGGRRKKQEEEKEKGETAPFVKTWRPSPGR